MKTCILISITILFLGCGGANNTSESSTIPPQPHATIDMAPPASPTLE